MGFIFAHRRNRRRIGPWDRFNFVDFPGFTLIFQNATTHSIAMTHDCRECILGSSSSVASRLDLGSMGEKR